MGFFAKRGFGCPRYGYFPNAVEIPVPPGAAHAGLDARDKGGTLEDTGQTAYQPSRCMGVVALCGGSCLLLWMVPIRCILNQMKLYEMMRSSRLVAV